jgi:predicted PurR-regulated permease PerM
MEDDPLDPAHLAGSRLTALGLTAWIGRLALTVAAIGGLILCALLAAPFLGALVWALTIAILFVPVQRRIEAVLGSAGLASLVTVLVAALVVAIPAGLVIERLVREAAASAAFIQARLADGTIRMPPPAQWVKQQIDLPAMVGRLTTWLSTAGASFLRGSLAQALELILTFYVLFFLLRDRRAAADLLRASLPLSEAQTEELFTRIVDTVHAIIFGTIVVATLQGTLGGLMFLALGLTAPLFWGVVMGLLSLVPVLGSFIVWIPAAIFMALEGHVVKAMILTVWGAVVVGGIDNILRPILVGNRLRLHTVPAFISIIGGLVLFGPVGFILGPLVVTITIVLVNALRERDTPAEP